MNKQIRIYLVVLFVYLSFLSSFTLLAQSSKISAGKFQSIYLPNHQTQLSGTTGGFKNASILWRNISGPSQVKIISPAKLSTIVSNLVAGEYYFELSATVPSKLILRDTVVVIVYNTADVKVPSSDEFPNLLGSNPGYYGPNWSDRQVYTMMAKAGCGSTRSTIPMFFFKNYGDSIRYREFKYFYDTLGFRENVYFLYNLSATDYPDQSEEQFNGERAVVPKGMYLPIWNDDGSVNSKNSFANYCYKSVTVYGKFFKYFEVWNEPDFTGNWGAAGALPGTAGNWWENDPKPADLYNLKAPGQYYVRMLRIAYEVIKRYKPDAIITLGGVGFPSFLQFVLRSTDNPEADKNGRKGSKNSSYPLTGGAYFDGLSFHSYPQFYLKYWDFTTGKMGYRRNSDEAIDQTIRDKRKFEKILWQFGYDGKKLPAKPFICTEINIPRKQILQDIGGIEVQKNFAWKTIAQAAKNQIKQVYWFVTAETADFANSDDGYKLMGLIKNVLATRPGREEMTEEGIANKSAQLLLKDFFYDASITKELNLPPGIDGVAWKDHSTGEVRFMMWAKSGKDLDESSEAFYSFPKRFANKKFLAYTADYAVSKKSAFILEPAGLKLTGQPYILVPSDEPAEKSSPRPQQKLIAFAGSDTIIHQQFINLRGSTNITSDRPINYYWDLISVPPFQADYPSIKNKYSINAVLMGLQKGLYGVRFTSSDQFGSFSCDTVWIAVDTLISFPVILAQMTSFENLHAGGNDFYLGNECTMNENALVRRRNHRFRKNIFNN